MASLLALAGCDGLLSGPGGLILGEDVLERYEVSPEGETIALSFNSLVEWSVNVDKGSGAEGWLSATPSAGPAANVNLSVTAGKNDTGKTRQGYLTIIAGTYEEKITFVQKSVELEEKDYFRLSLTEVSMTSEGGEFELTVHTDHGYKVDVLCDWITESSVESTTHVFAVQANESESERVGVVTLCSDLGTCVSVTVAQEGAEKTTPDWPEAVHKSLAMRFTADWCVYCPLMAENFRLAAEQIPGRFEVLNIHGYGSSYEFADYPAFETYFGITGYPTGVVDFRRNVYETESVVSAVEETEANYETSAVIEASTKMDGRHIVADVKLHVRTAGEYRVTAIVAENGIVGSQTGASSDYVHDRVARLSLTDPLGDAVVVSEDYSVIDLSFDGDVPQGCNLVNLELIVFVTREFGDQQKISDYGDLYVDNCIVVGCGAESDDAAGEGEDITQGEDIEM